MSELALLVSLALIVAGAVAIFQQERRAQRQERLNEENWKKYEGERDG